MKSAWLVLLALLLAGCAAPAPTQRPTPELILPPALAGLSADLAAVASDATPAVVRIDNQTQILKPARRYFSGLLSGLIDLVNPYPYWDWPYRIVRFPFYLAFGYLDLSTARGSGFLVDEQHVVTAAHVVENAAVLRCQLSDGRRTTATIMKVDPELDLALLRLDDLRGPPPTPLRLRRFVTRPGEAVLAIGYPSREVDATAIDPNLPPNPRLTVGIVSATNVELGNPRTAFVELDAALNPGNSGGPIVGLDGTVIGVAGMVGVGKENEGYAVPAGTVRTAFPDLLKESR